MFTFIQFKDIPMQMPYCLGICLFEENRESKRITISEVRIVFNSKMWRNSKHFSDTLEAYYFFFNLGESTQVFIIFKNLLFLIYV